MTDFYDEFPEENIEEIVDDDPEPLADERIYRGGTGDPLFGFLLALAISIGLIPSLPDNADLRYTLAWGSLALVGVLAWLLGNTERIEQEQPENIAWGVAFGVMVSLPFAFLFSDIFGRATGLMFPFPEKQLGTVLAYLVFVMPLAETLFFRGLLQRHIEFYIVGALAGLWSVILFFPVMWAEILEAPAVAVFLGVALVTLNMLYSYVHDRNGLAAAWISQIIACVVLFFVPFISV